MYGLGRFAALTIALVEIVGAYLLGGGLLAGKLTCYLLLPIFCIFWPRSMGSFTGSFMTWHNISYPTPSWLVASGGWLLLLLPIGSKVYWAMLQA
jgi:hypothetical protein